MNVEAKQLTPNGGDVIIRRMEFRDHMAKIVDRALDRIFSRYSLVLCLILLMLTISYEWPDVKSESFLYQQAIRGRTFDHIEWEIKQLTDKLLYASAPAHAFMEPDDQQRVALGLLQKIDTIKMMTDHIEMVYSNNDAAEAKTIAAPLEEMLANKRLIMKGEQLAAEAVIEEAVAQSLAEEGIAVLGRVFPPVRISFTPLPTLLIVSPRERIESEKQMSLEHGLTATVRDEIENKILESLDKSALVSDIGGMAAFPAMLLENPSLDNVVSTTAHEWTHHMLAFRPLGWRYRKNDEMRTMNETTASIVGNEVGPAAARILRQEEPTSAHVNAENKVVTEPPAFDFRQEMRTTRIRVDDLLEKGYVSEAEEYMETQRQLFLKNGYRIRKLNQAYFAFHGAYADEPGEQGDDPVGPSVTELREKSDSLREFLLAISSLSDYSELEELVSP